MTRRGGRLAIAAALGVVGVLWCPRLTWAAGDEPLPRLEKKNPNSLTTSSTKEPAHRARVELGGYLKPGFGFRYRSQAIPKDQYEYGFLGTAGLIVDAEPFEHWHARVHVRFSAQVLEAVTGLEMFDLQGDGRLDGISYSTASVPGALLREASVRYQPFDALGLRAGAMRIPFSLQQQSSSTSLMFPSRSASNRLFLSGADFGALISSRVADGIFTGSVGVFNGDSLGFPLENIESRGVVLSGRADVNPLGEFAFGEGDQQRGPFRIGVGGGMLFRPATLYDERTGTEEKNVHDLRMSASLRVAVRGFYFAAEYFRRQQTDDYSSRPQLADGAYAQMAFYFPIANRVGVEPIVRAGFVHYDQSFDPRLIANTSAGLNFYPVATAERPSDVKVTVQYLGDRSFTDDEDAHGVAATAQLLF